MESLSRFLEMPKSGMISHSKASMINSFNHHQRTFRKCAGTLVLNSRKVCQGGVFACGLCRLDFLPLSFLDGDLPRFPGREAAEPGEFIRIGFMARADADGQFHSLLVQCSVPCFFLGQCGLLSRCQVGGRGGCASGRGHR